MSAVAAPRRRQFRAIARYAMERGIVDVFHDLEEIEELAQHLQHDGLPDRLVSLEVTRIDLAALPPVSTAPAPPAAHDPVSSRIFGLGSLSSAAAAIPAGKRRAAMPAILKQIRVLADDIERVVALKSEGAD